MQITKKVFIFEMCDVCNEPVGILQPCKELGYNVFLLTNFHGKLSIEKTEELKKELIQLLKESGEFEKANYIKNNTKVLEITYNI